MYGMYDKDGKYRAMKEQVEQVNQRLEAAEKEESNKKMLILGVSLIIGLIPIGYIGTQVIREQTWKTNTSGTVLALSVAFIGGLALFAFNYGFLYLKVLHYEIFKYVFSLVIVIALIVGASVLLRKKKNK